MTFPQLDPLVAAVGAPVRRVVFARGIEAWRDDDTDGWQLPRVPHDGAGRAASSLAALGLRAVDDDTAEGTRRGALGTIAPPRSWAPHLDPAALAARHHLAPLLLVTATALGGELPHVVSAVGTTGWRPPIEQLYDDPTLGARARRLRFLVDGIEHHAARAAESYAAAADTARRTAALFGTRELTTLTGQTTLFVELDALLVAVQRTYAATGRLLAAAFPTPRTPRVDVDTAFDMLVLRARAAPFELRESLLDAWESHGMHTGAYRRALRARDARELGHAPVQLARLGADVWAVSVAVTTPARDGARAGIDALPRRVDALDRAWAMATDAMRVLSLVLYAIERRGASS